MTEIVRSQRSFPQGPSVSYSDEQATILRSKIWISWLFGTHFLYFWILHSIGNKHGILRSLSRNGAHLLSRPLMLLLRAHPLWTNSHSKFPHEASNDRSDLRLS